MSVTWSYEPTFPDFLTSVGRTHNQTNCMMDVFNQLNGGTDTVYNQLSDDYPPTPSGLNYNFYGHLDTTPCNSTLSPNTPQGATVEDAHILRINFGPLQNVQPKITINLPYFFHKGFLNTLYD